MQSLLLSYAPSFLIITCGLALSGGYLFLSTVERHLATMRQCEALAVASICIAAAIYIAPVAPAHYVLRAIAANGDVYIAGSGDTCNQAVYAAVYPDNVRSVSCDRD